MTVTYPVYPYIVKQIQLLLPILYILILSSRWNYYYLSYILILSSRCYLSYISLYYQADEMTVNYPYYTLSLYSQADVTYPLYSFSFSFPSSRWNAWDLVCTFKVKISLKEIHASRPHFKYIIIYCLFRILHKSYIKANHTAVGSIVLGLCLVWVCVCVSVRMCVCVCMWVREC